MGLGTKENNATFVKVVKGLGLVVRVQEGTEGAKPRTLKTGDEVHELIYDHLSGYVKDIEVRNADYNGKSIKFWSIKIEDAGSTYLLSLPYSSRYSSSFLKRLPNVDLAKRLTIHVAHFDQDDTTALWLSQEGEKVLQAFTKEEPNGLPEMEQVKIKGELQWDDTAMMEFLQNLVDKDIKPKLEKLKAIEPTAQPNDVATEAPISEEEEDDLPF